MYYLEPTQEQMDIIAKVVKAYSKSFPRLRFSHDGCINGQHIFCADDPHSGYTCTFIINHTHLTAFGDIPSALRAEFDRFVATATAHPCRIIGAQQQRAVCTNCGHIGPYPAPSSCPKCNSTAMRLDDAEPDGSLQIEESEKEYRPKSNPFVTGRNW